MTTIPPEPPPNPPNCTCGPWTWSGRHWTFLISSDCPVHAKDLAMMTSAVTGVPAPEAEPSPLDDDTYLGFETLESCDGCGIGVSALWLVFTHAGELTLCGEHHRRFMRARDA